MTYWTEFRHVHPKVRQYTRELVVAKPWREDQDRQYRVMKYWLRKVSAVYRCPIPGLRFNSSAQDCGGGYYHPGLQEITLSHCSIVTLLHEYRHHLQHQPGFRSHIRGAEKDARAWSLSLFHRVAPRRFRRMVRARRILHTVPSEVA